MIYHVLPGDALAAEFKKTDIEGEVIVCRECLIVGPVDAESTDEFWDERARFILSDYGEDEIEFHERVADELEKLGDVEPNDEVDLWFEYELFCSVNMWFCIAKLADSGAAVYRVEPVMLSKEDRWKGFGFVEEGDLEKCFAERKYLSKEDLQLGSNLWNAYKTNDHEQLKDYAGNASNRFPYLDEVVDAAIERNRTPKKILKAILDEGTTEFQDVFLEFTKRAGVYGYGDLQVERLMDQL